MGLIEVMVVLVIMTTLMGAAAIGVMNAWNRSRIHDTSTRARTIQSAATMYRMEEGGECPATEDLAQILDSTKEHTDAWGNDFAIECDANTVHVLSPGPDEALGTDDDIGF